MTVPGKFLSQSVFEGEEAASQVEHHRLLAVPHKILEKNLRVTNTLAYLSGGEEKKFGCGIETCGVNGAADEENSG